MKRIQRELERAAIPLPVVNLVYMSPPMQTYPEILRAVESGESEETLGALARRLYRDDLRSIVGILQPAVYHRGDVPGDCLVEIQGVFFSFVPEMQSTIEDGILNVSENGMVLKNKDGEIVMPPTMGLYNGDP